MNLPLQDIRVLELGQVIAAPFAGAIFSDLGAQVVKVERVDGGDDARRMGPAFVRSDAMIFHVFNRGKQSVALDLKSEAGIQALKELLAQTDIFVHNLRPGVVQQLGLDAATLTQAFPRLIYAEISGYGASGPLALKPGYEPLLQAFSGMSSLNGAEGDAPVRSATSLCDQGSGMWVVIGCLSLLHRRQATGQGGVVQSSLLETAMVWNAQKSDALLNEGRLPEKHRSGHPGFVPYEAFDTADLPLLICCGNDRLFVKLATALGRTAWSTDPRFVTNRARLAHKAELMHELIPLLQQQSRSHWLALLDAAGVPCSPIHSLQEALEHEQVQALELMREVPHDGFRLTAMPLLIDGQRPAPTGPAPSLGEHNGYSFAPTPPHL